jgi:hypothetical protein
MVSTPANWTLISRDWVRGISPAPSRRATARNGCIESAILFGTAYGLCLVGGLSEVQRIADDRTQAGLTARYYTLAYVGFAVPYALSLAGHVASYAIVLAATAALALATAALVTHRAASTPSDRARTDR